MKTEAEALAAAEKAGQDYCAALNELAGMPRRGRPSARKLELITFITEYESVQAQSPENSHSRPAGRPKKVLYLSSENSVKRPFKGYYSQSNVSKLSLKG